MVLNKIILIFCVICTFLKLNNSEVFTNGFNFTTAFRSDDFININRRQYERTLQDFDAQLEIFKQLFNERLNTLHIQQGMLSDSQKINDEHLNPLEILSDFGKHCVRKYRPKIPTIESSKTAIESCITTAKNQLSSLLSSPLNTKNNLQNYYKNTFEKEITNCDKKHGNILAFNYTSCIISLVSTVNAVTLSNQKNFYTQIETSQCNANSHIKKAIDCSFLAQNHTLSLMSEANTLINMCLENLGNSADFCSDVFYMRQADVDYKNFSITNPFYGRNKSIHCLLIKFY